MHVCTGLPCEIQLILWIMVKEKRSFEKHQEGMAKREL